MDRFVCIHGHFYQPPRENPWLEAIELQDSAYPYHDWNQRIAAECYGPNARSRILDAEGRITQIANNYARISHNIGPTLIKWLQDEAPEVYSAALQADRESRDRFSGHGSAIAQVYNHMIMPLANRGDKYTQVLWGIRDFEHRYGRAPEAMWLPETAVDIETLDIMAGFGLRYVILEPGQAKRFRASGARAWTDAAGIDPTRAYWVRLPSGRRINAFFYDGPISRAVAFEGLLTSGERFVERLKSGFSDERDWPQLVHIATDGESYGHHHRYGDMALAYALERIQQDEGVCLTNYGEYLERFPAAHEVEIVENTSWSCVHGVERWRSNCGCSTGGRPGWNQEWRGPLRDALDWLRDCVAPLYEQQGAQLFRDPWQARNDYISVILDRSEDNVRDFLSRHNARDMSGDKRTKALQLLEMQRHALLMYASCGWFFDDLSGIETVQVLQYAGRVIQLAEMVSGSAVEDGFLDILSGAKSNLPEQGDGRTVYDRYVRPAIVNLEKVAAHYAISSLFEEYPERAVIYCYSVATADYNRESAGAAQMAVGHGEVTSGITGQSREMTFGVLHFGDHNLTAGVRPFAGDAMYEAMKAEVTTAFERADLPEVLRLLDRHFGELTYSLRSMFKDEQRKVLDSILAGTVAEAEASYRQAFEHHAPLMRFLLDVGSPLPAPFHAAAELVVNANLRRALEADSPDPDRVRDLLRDVHAWNVRLDNAGMAFAAENTLRRLAERFAEEPADVERLAALERAAEIAKEIGLPVNLSEAQDRYWTVFQEFFPAQRERAQHGDTEAARWVGAFRSLGDRLSFRLDTP